METNKISRISLIAMDVDGVLTDGSIIFGSGGLESKRFFVRDGHGIKLAQRAGLKIAFITGRSSEVTERRAAELGVSDVYQNAHRKLEPFRELLGKYSLDSSQVCYIGDDVVDIPVMRNSGFSVAVADAASEVCAVADYVTNKPGGRGAVREVIEVILKSKKLWEKVTGRYYE
ncbi:MAG: KdsC family phosphatase [bacterium]